MDKTLKIMETLNLEIDENVDLDKLRQLENTKSKK